MQMQTVDNRLGAKSLQTRSLNVSVVWNTIIIRAGLQTEILTVHTYINNIIIL